VVSLEATSIQRLETQKSQHEEEIFVVVSDITDRIKAEEALQESETRWRKYILYAPVGIFVANMNGEYLQVNPAACRITGLSESELLSRNVFTLLPKESEELVLAHFQKLIDSGESFGEVVYRHPEGDERWWSVAAAKVTDELTIGFVEDISERKNQEKQRELLQNQINQLAKAESLGRMAGAIAHYFNNTLAAVLGNLELAIEDTPKEEKSLLCLKPALQATKRASEMSRLMLTYLGQMMEKKEPVDLSEICKDGLPLLLLGKPENIEIELDCPFPGPIIQANSNQIQQIIASLLVNAWESIENGFGKIRVTISTIKKSNNIHKQYSHPIEWRIEEREYACIEVVDNGCGITKDDLENLFDPFFSSKFPGRGMGLAVVVGILRSHQGGITVESQSGKGSTFRVYLPTADPTTGTGY
jgi:PAS domain S-box-containing protein